MASCGSNAYRLFSLAAGWVHLREGNNHEREGNLVALPAEQRTALGKDLRSFIRFLEKFYPDEILRVREEVDPIFEVTAMLWRLERERRFPVVIFDKIKGSEIPCVTNVHASFPRLAMAIGLGIDATPRDFVLEYMRREDKGIEPVFVNKDKASCKEIILTGSDVDVFMLPMLKYHELDSGRVDPGYEAQRGRYITLGYEIMKDPDTGIRNAGIYRLQAKSRNKFGIQISETAHGHYIMQKNLTRGRPTQMAVAIGLHPLWNSASSHSPASTSTSSPWQAPSSASRSRW